MKSLRTPRIGVSAAALALAAGLLAAEPAQAPGDTIRNHFDADSPVRPPGFFDFTVLGQPGAARWLVLTDLNPPSTANRLAQVETGRPSDSIAAAVRRTYTFQDGTVSAFLRRGASRGGVLLRHVDDRNFLVLLVDTAGGEAVLTSYRDGKPTELGKAAAPLERDWVRYSVKASGPSLSVFVDDRKLFEGADPFPASGRAGLVTAGPGEASFDEFVIEFQPAS